MKKSKSAIIIVDGNGQAWDAESIAASPEPLDLSPRQIAAILGRRGGQARSPAKTAAARANARLPRKKRGTPEAGSLGH